VRGFRGRAAVTSDAALIKRHVITAIRPALILACGAQDDPKLLDTAQMLDSIGNGRVLVIEVEQRHTQPIHPRIDYLQGSPIAPKIVESVSREVAAVTGPVMVTIRSPGGVYHALTLMKVYQPLVTAGSYLIIERGEMEKAPNLRAAVVRFLTRRPLRQA